jgi:hypothetical protein
MDPAHQREITEPVGLTAHLGDQCLRLATARRQQHLHARAQSLDGLAG